MFEWLKIFIAKVLDRDFILTYPDGMRTRRLKYEYLDYLYHAYGGKLTICWRNR